MSAKYPVLPIAGGTLVRVFASVLAFVTRWLKELLEARRHRREANVLAGLDRRMLADIGITACRRARRLFRALLGRSDCALRERALERRLNHLRCAAPNSISAAARSLSDQSGAVRLCDEQSKRPIPLIGRSIRHPRSSPSRGWIRARRPPAGAIIPTKFCAASHCRSVPAQPQASALTYMRASQPALGSDRARMQTPFRLGPRSQWRCWRLLARRMRKAGSIDAAVII